MRATLLLAVLALGCEAPEDGVLRIAFLLEPPPPSESRVAPPEAETGVHGVDFGQARGRCDCDVEARTVKCTFENLPPTSALTRQPLAYELRFLLWYGRLPARFDARLLDRDPGGRDPDAPPPPMTPPLPRAMAGPVTPDPFGKAERLLEAAPGIPVDRIVGAEVHLVLQRPTGEPGRYLIIDGRLGNLAEAGEAAAPAPVPAGGGHQH